MGERANSRMSAEKSTSLGNRPGSVTFVNETTTVAGCTSSHLSAKLDNTFYADKLAGLRAKILNIQSKHEQTL